MAKPLTIHDFITKSNNIHDNKYNYSKSIYINNKQKIEIICPEHGSFWQIAYDHSNGRGCPKCGTKKSCSSRTMKFGDFIIKSNKIHNNKYDYSKSIYNNSNIKIEIICPEHGSFWQKPKYHSTYEQGCPKCRYDTISKKQTITTKEFISKSNEIHNNKYDYSLSNYTHNKQKINIICKKHGIFNQEPNGHLNGNGCPRCGITISNQHQKIVNYLYSIGLTNNNIQINNKTILQNYEIDIYLPNYNIGIEINGIYYHSDKFKHKKYHQHKFIESCNNNIKLIQFWEHEINNKFNIVSSIINNNIGLSNRIYARNCEILILNNNSIQQFVNNNHLQGHRDARINYCLTYNNEIINILSLSKHQEYEWEIIRSCTKTHNNVVGGFSKLFKKFIKDNNPKTIMTFADARYSTGNVYIKNGFKPYNLTQPNYFYSKNKTIISRQQCQKHKLHKLLKEKFNKNKSEYDNMITNGYHKIHDAGHIKLLWTK